MFFGWKNLRKQNKKNTRKLYIDNLITRIIIFLRSCSLQKLSTASSFEKNQKCTFSRGRDNSNEILYRRYGYLYIGVSSIDSLKLRERPAKKNKWRPLFQRKIFNSRCLVRILSGFAGQEVFANPNFEHGSLHPSVLLTGTWKIASTA